MNYYNEIKETFVKNEVYKKIKDYSKNKSDLNTYFEVGRLIVEAQGGEARAKYGNKLIKEYSEKLTKELGKGYTYTNLSRMRQFYLLSLKVAAVRPLSGHLTWTHYCILLSIKDINEIKYYVNIAISNNLSSRELEKCIKSKEYERLGKDVNVEEPKVNSLIKNSILIKVNNKNEKLTEYTLHQSILENMEDFLKELGVGFAFIGSEVKIKLGDRYNYIDFLLFNVKFNCYVVIELKVTEMKAEYIGQVIKYVNYVDKNIKEVYNEPTVGVIICKKENKYVMEYCTNPNIFVSTYQTI